MTSSSVGVHSITYHVQTGKSGHAADAIHKKDGRDLEQCTYLATLGVRSAYRQSGLASRLIKHQLDTMRAVPLATRKALAATATSESNVSLLLYDNVSLALHLTWRDPHAACAPSGLSNFYHWLT